MDRLEPGRESVARCRCCHGSRIVNLGYVKRFHLPNLDCVVEMPYAACADCKLIFQASTVGDAFLRHYYENSPMLRRAETTPFEADQHRRQSEFLARHCPGANRRVLEIGAGSGGFLAHLREPFEPSEPFACETWFDELSTEATATMLSIPGLKKLTPDAGRFDLIVLRHVLEHIDDIDAFLGRLDALLDEAGALFVEVPDWSVFDRDCDPLIFEHLSQFNPHCLLTLFARLGWTCDALEKSVCATDPATPNRVMRALFRKPPHGLAAAQDTADAFRQQYLPLYEAVNRKVDRLLAEHPEKTLALYPASHLSHSLLLETRLCSARLLGMFDVDPKKQGKEFRGIRVHAPRMLEELQPDIVLIATLAYEDEIRQALAALNLRSTIVGIKGLLSGADFFPEGVSDDQ